MTWSPNGTSLLLTMFRVRRPESKGVRLELYTVDRSGKSWRRVPLEPGLTSCSVSSR